MMAQVCHPIYKIEIKPLEVQSLTGKTSDIVINALTNRILMLNIEDRIIWGNTNLMKHNVMVKKIKMGLN